MCWADIASAGKKIVAGLLAAAIFLPEGYTIIPTLDLLNKLHLQSSLWGLTLAESGGVQVMMILLFAGYFSQLPGELEEAAIMDGAGFARIFAQIYLPLTKPVIATCIILQFMHAWNDFLCRSSSRSTSPSCAPFRSASTHSRASTSPTTPEWQRRPSSAWRPSSFFSSCCSAISSKGSQVPSSSDRPNVVVFLTDQQRWDSMGSHGNPLDLTPNLDRLAARGTLVDKAFTCQPVCGPARGVLQTGCYPTVNGVHHNGLRLWDGPTLAKDFTAAGYDTAYIGKWHLAGTRAAVPAELRGGYDYWLGADAVEFVSDAYDAKLFDNDDRPNRLPGYRSDAFIDAAIDYLGPRPRPAVPALRLDSRAAPPEFPDDYPAPEGYRERYEGRWMPADLQALGGNAAQSLGGYWGMIKRIDEGFGRLLDALRTEGLSDNTVVAFTSDHGCHFKTRNAEYKRSEHEASIRIPMVLAGPGFDGGGRIQDMMSLIDLPPTLLDAARIEVPERMQGRSIVPLVNRNNAGWPDDIFVQISESCVGRAIRTRDYKYAVIADGVPGREPSSDTYTEATLYDLTADPHELTNLIGHPAFAEVTGALRDRLVRRMVEAGEKVPTIVPAPALPPGGQRVPRPMDRPVSVPA